MPHLALAHLRNELDDLQVVKIGQEPGWLGKKVVPGQHRHSCAILAVHSRLASTQIALVKDIIVHQTRSVDHLCDLSKLSVLRSQLPVQ